MSDALGRTYANATSRPSRRPGWKPSWECAICGVPPTGRVGDLDSPGTEDAGAGQVEDAVFRHRLSGNMAGLFQPGRGQHGRCGQPAAGRGPQLPVVPWPGWAGRWTRPNGGSRRRRSVPSSCSSRTRTTFPLRYCRRPSSTRTAPDAANYGAIGATVGHEVSHFVDMLGAEWDAENRMRHWWTPEDLSRFQAAADPLVNQLSGYRPRPDLAINGKLTQTENIADLAGLAAAFDAYRGTLGAKATDRAYVRRQDREFFIGFARSWRGKIRDEALRTQSPRTATPPRASASPPSATSMHGTTRSTCGRGSGSTSSPRRGCGSGKCASPSASFPMNHTPWRLPGPGCVSTRRDIAPSWCCCRSSRCWSRCGPNHSSIRHAGPRPWPGATLG